MLLAVEGGGFFSSSALGYGKGLALLILGQGNEDKHMRVSPWNQYQLVDKKANNPYIQLASRKKRLFCGCAPFICFDKASAGRDGPSPPKVGPVQHPQTLPNTSSPSNRDDVCSSSEIVDDSETKVLLRSSLKKTASASCSVVVGEGGHGHDSLQEAQSDASDFTGRRTVQWRDACGQELVEVKEFENNSDEDTDDEEYELNSGRTCQCVIQ